MWQFANLRLRNQDKSSEEFKRKQKDIMQTSVDYFRFYNSALENLVEGQREVANNPNFEFEDGTTV